MGKILNKIYFRADGNSKTGLGHVIRSLALAEMLMHDFECHFIIREPGKYLSDQVLSSGVSLHEIPSKVSVREEADYVVSNFLTGMEFVVLDGYRFDLSYQRSIKKTGCVLICIDDIHAYPFIADAIINHAGGIDKSHYDLSFYTQCCFGTDFLLLRKPFLEATKVPREISSVDTVFVCMGGADPSNFTKKVLENYLERIEGLKTCYVVLGNSYPFTESLEQVIGKSAFDIQILRNLSATEMVSYMQRSQIGICSASGICYEYLCAGGGLFIVLTVDNQLDLYHFLLDHKLAALLSGLGNEYEFNKMVSRQREVADGRSPERFIKLLKKLSKKLSLKEARPEELHLYHQWANDPLTRAQSFNTQPIPIKDHEKWFNHKLADPQTCLFTAFFDHQPIGQIRFDLKDEEALISYSVAPEHRGSGYGFSLIKQGILELIKDRSEIKTITGYVRQENIASSKTFKRLNFTETSPDDPEKYPDSLKYILNVSNEII